MRYTVVLITLAIAMTVGSVVYFVVGKGEVQDRTAEVGERNSSEVTTIAAPGVVEAATEEIEVGSELPGKLRAVLVEEGDSVTKGETVAILENSDYEALLQTAKANVLTLASAKESAKARVAQAEADRARIANGARREERIEARAAYEQTLPNVENAKIEFERSEKLWRTGDISREEYDRSRTALKNAERIATTARERFNLINADARIDDVAKAEAVIRVAESEVRNLDAQIAEASLRVQEAEARLAKTVIRAPISGVVLRIRSKSGESVSPENSLGVITIADTTSLRVRVDLDETDVSRIASGQNAYITADAFGTQRFSAKVSKIGEIMGRKNFRTERPTEKVDTKILEVLLELAPGQKLPLGLRVDVFITAGEKQ